MILSKINLSFIFQKAYGRCKGAKRRRKTSPDRSNHVAETPEMRERCSIEDIGKSSVDMDYVPSSYLTRHCATCICGADVPNTRNVPQQMDASMQTDDAIIITVETVPTVKEVCNTLEEVLQNVHDQNTVADLPALNVARVSPRGTATYSTGTPSPGHTYTPLVNTPPITWDTGLVQPIAAVTPYSVDGRPVQQERHLHTEASTTWDTSDDHMSQVSSLLKKKKNCL